MPGWSDILDEVMENPQELNNIRQGYINKLEQYTNRNVIIYYSGFLSIASPNLDINDSDMNGFMSAVHGVDRSKGLDLILHTPGGSPTASESIVKYLRKMFNNDIRVIVPQMAMSAGTMISCSAKEIIMGYHSSLGPIDPQFNGIPAYNIQAEFEEAEQELALNPNKVQYWAIKLQQYPAAFLKQAIDAIELSSVLLEEWLGTCMFDKYNTNDAKIIRNIVSALNEHNNSKAHDRHFDVDTCIGFGLKVTHLESDPELQDKVLSIHHCASITIEVTNTSKIIEGPGKAYIITSEVQNPAQMDQ